MKSLELYYALRSMKNFANKKMCHAVDPMVKFRVSDGILFL
jgi:hypothetical protein